MLLQQRHPPINDLLTNLFIERDDSFLFFLKSYVPYIFLNPHVSSLFSEKQNRYVPAIRMAEERCRW